CQTNSSQHQTALQDQPQNAATAGPNRQPYADLARPLRHLIAQQSEQTNYGQKHRKTREPTRHPAKESWGCYCVVDHSLHRRQLGDRHLRVCITYRLLHRCRDVHIAGEANSKRRREPSVDHLRHLVGRLRKWRVKHHLGRLSKRMRFRVRDYAYNRPWNFVSQQNALTDWRLSGPPSVRRGLAHDNGFLRVRTISSRHVAAHHQRNTKRTKISGRHQTKLNRLTHLWPVGGRSAHVQTTVQWKTIYRGHLLHARITLKRRIHLVDKLLRMQCGLVGRSLQRHLGDLQALRFYARRCRTQL